MKLYPEAVRMFPDVSNFKALYELTADELERLLTINPALMFGSYDEQPEKFANNAIGCTVSPKLVRIEEDCVKFTADVTVVGEGNRAVGMHVYGIMKPNSVMYFSPLPPDAISIMLNLIRENNVVYVTTVNSMTEPCGGVHPMLAFFKNLSAYVDALHGAIGLLESNINQLRQMAEQTDDENLKATVEALENEAIDAIRRINSLLPKITETYAAISKRASN
ncbi:hypothetical protein [Pseudothermotoga sp.]|nr:hypothetical protein [Pseudothermotoga sp.]MDW8140403.1 hypothetical protein [Pseudothermotoga sp.]